MAEMLANSSKSRSITSKFNRSLFLIFFLLSLASVPAVYYLTKVQVMSQANQELTLLVDMVKSVRNVVREDTRPHFLPKGEFFPAVVSSTVMAKTVAEKFARVRPEYYIKIFADNPLNLEDLPDQLESQLLRRFRDNRDLTSIVETGIIQGQEYLLSSAPAVAKDGCLICHGDPKDAPQAIKDQYGTDSGYGWKVGSVVGGSAVGVPLSNVNEIAIRRAGFTLIGLAIIFGIIFLLINRLVRKNIIKPIGEIAELAREISKGRVNTVMPTYGNDEVGRLASAFELMRRSFIVLMKRNKEQKKNRP